MHMQTTSVQALQRVAPQNANHDSVARNRLGQVYAVLFSDGWVKVGRGRNAQKRIDCHISASLMRGAKLVDSRISGLILDSRGAEAALIAMCGGYASAVHGREWFQGVDFDSLAALIDDQYSGDSQEKISEYLHAFDRKTDQVFAAIANQVSSAPKFTDADMGAWSSALEHASVLEQIYLDDCYGGQLFAKEHKGYSSFYLMTALALYKVPAQNVAVIYWKAFNEPDQLLSELSDASAKSCAELLHTHDKAVRGAA